MTVKKNGLLRRCLAMLAIASIALLAAGMPRIAAANGPEMQVFKTPWCGCCAEWVDHMRSAGFSVQVTDLEDMTPAKAHFGVADDLQACHTAVVDGYVVEGHVPAPDVLRLLSERPRATGVAVPGMPAGSPGMEQGNRKDRYDVILFSSDSRSIYSRY